jgi:hypothetical protein
VPTPNHSDRKPVSNSSVLGDESRNDSSDSNAHDTHPLSLEDSIDRPACTKVLPAPRQRAKENGESLVDTDRYFMRRNASSSSVSRKMLETMPFPKTLEANMWTVPIFASLVAVHRMTFRSASTRA